MTEKRNYEMELISAMDNYLNNYCDTDNQSEKLFRQALVVAYDIYALNCEIKSAKKKQSSNTNTRRLDYTDRLP